MLCAPTLPASLLLVLSLFQRGPDLSGTWVFTETNGRFEGTIFLRQSGQELSGTWHTSRGKSEPDTSVVGRIDGAKVMLTRSIGNNQQNYVLTLSADGNHLEGFGDGWEIKHAGLNMRRAMYGAASMQPSLPASGPASSARAPTAGKKQKWMGIGLPPQRGTYRWMIQSVVSGIGRERRYTSFYYEPATGRSVEQPLSLPRGGEIIGVFPDDCAFSVQDQAGHSFTFQNEDQAKAKGFGPGTWSVYPLKCSGIGVYVK